jgi:hypothetical protein
MSSPDPVTFLGQGYDTFLTSGKRSVLSNVKFEENNPKAEGDGNSTAVNIIVTKDKKQIYKELGIDASLAVSGGWGSFKDTVSFVNSFEMTKSTIVILVSAKTITTTSGIEAPPTLATQYDNAADLYAIGGDCYVSHISKGGRYMAAYTFTAYDEEKYNSLSNTAKAEFGAGSFDSSFTTKIQNIEKTTNLSSTFTQQGVGFSKTKLPSQKDLVDFVLDFGEEYLDGPAVMGFSTTSYGPLKNCPPFRQVDKYRREYISPIDGSNEGTHSYYESLAHINLPIVKSVAALYANYGSLGLDPDLEKAEDNLKNILRSIRDWRENVNEDPTDPDIAPPEINTRFLKLPTAQFSVVDGEDNGGKLGNEFNDITTTDIYKGKLPKTVVTRESDQVDCLTTTYEEKLVPGSPKVVTVHGTSGGGNVCIDCELGPGEIITKIWASTDNWHDAHVDRLGLQTPFRKLPKHEKANGSILTTWEFSPNSCFVGWAGKCFKYLDSVRPKMVEFRKAIWQ